VREVAHARKRNPLFDLDKILQDGRYPDVISYANFGDDRLRGLEVEGSNLPFSTDFVLQHSRSIPCECVITLTTCYFWTRELRQSQRWPSASSRILMDDQLLPT